MARLSFSGRTALGIFALSSIFVSIQAANNECSCGYYDDTTREHWTDSIIVYFNETDSLPTEDFMVQEYENKYEKGWNTVFREGAKPSNVVIGNSTNNNGTASQSLQLWCDPTTKDHLVVGGGIRTQRQDIFFGTFRALFKGSVPYDGGSALSMTAVFNETESWQMDNINQDTPDLAWVAMLAHGQFPDRWAGVNYSQLTNTSIKPWDYTEYRVDWTRDGLRYFLDGELQRDAKRSNDSMLPQTPAPVTFKHWSTGNQYSTQGPPAARSMANVQWIRMFFNSSLATDDSRAALNARCSASTACSINDMQLRRSSSYMSDATAVWKQVDPARGNRPVPTAILITCICASFLLVVFTLAKRVPWNNLKSLKPGSKKHVHETPYAQSVTLIGGDSVMPSYAPTFAGSNTSTPWMSPHGTRPSSLNGVANDTHTGSQNGESSVSSSRKASVVDSTLAAKASSKTKVLVESVLPTPTDEHNKQLGEDNSPHSSSSRLETLEEKSELAREATAFPEHITPLPDNIVPLTIIPKKRVDYLAGLLVLSSLLVTAIHFCLTFMGAAVDPTAFAHNASETWARKIITTFFLNLNWIGPFLMTSTRFLVASYLKKGDLKGLAEKTVGRPPRLLIPIACIAMLEYFLMDSGATHWLEYLPSVSWSIWPFTTVPSNFGVFVSEILQLGFLIPNAAPQITFNYCTGVLWTIPVQLQGSWTTMLGVVMIRAIKTPWKRFVFYTWCILLHWYALSWATYFYTAILLTDLEITYNWKPWMMARRYIYWPAIILAFVLAVGGLGVDFATQWTNANYAQDEYGIHPDIPTGLAYKQSPLFTYPQYFVPKLNGLVFSVGLQTLIELSPAVQSLFSLKVLTYVHPHIFTIYLIHGFIFWSLGATICVHLATTSIPYELNILIVAICCYATLFLSLPLLTPIVEGLGKTLTALIWQRASKGSPRHRRTLYPFDSDLLERKEVVLDLDPKEVEEKDFEKGDMDVKVIGGEAKVVTHTTVDRDD